MGETRQSAHRSQLIYTGTPDGVRAVMPGGRITGSIHGDGEVSLDIGQPE